MANRLKKMMAPILEEECNKAFKRGFEEGKQAGWDNKSLAYENKIEFLKRVIKRLEKRSAPKFLFKDGEMILLNQWEWISVKDRLPEETCTVIAYSLGGWIGTILYNGGRKRFEECGVWAPITHWMPLPQPPKGE